MKSAASECTASPSWVRYLRMKRDRVVFQLNKTLISEQRGVRAHGLAVLGAVPACAAAGSLQDIKWRISRLHGKVPLEPVA